MRFTVGKKLWIGFSTVFVLMVLTAYFGSHELKRLAAIEDVMMNTRYPTVTLTWDLRVSTQKSNALQKNYMLLAGHEPDGAEAAEVKRDWNATWRRIEKDVAALNELSKKVTQVENRQQIAELTRLETEVHQLQKAMLFYGDLHTAESARHALELMRTEGNPRALQMQRVAIDLGESTEALIQQSAKQVNAARQKTLWTLLGSTVLAIITGGMVALWLSQRIVVALGAVVKHAKAIAAGDLTGSPLPAKSRDEMAELSTAINTMQSNLAGLLQSIAQNAGADSASAAAKKVDEPSKSSDQAALPPCNRPILPIRSTPRAKRFPRLIRAYNRLRPILRNEQRNMEYTKMRMRSSQTSDFSGGNGRGESSNVPRTCSNTARLASGILVLIAEDSPTQQETARAVLAELGCRTDVVANGGEALQALRQSDYDLVLMDCQMPEMDGHEATRRIRNPESGARNPEIPIIAVTANTGPDDCEACLRSGMNAYLTKPLQAAQLAALMENWVALVSRRQS